MVTRIELILKTQNLTPTQFADAIGIQRSSMSHILARRNNPSLDFVVKVLNRFPDLSSEWLLNGRGQMYKTSSPALSGPVNTTRELDLDFESKDKGWFNERDTPKLIEEPEIHLNWENERDTPQKEIRTSTDTEKTVTTPQAELKKEIHNSDIERIIIFFKDGRFKIYNNNEQ